MKRILASALIIGASTFGLVGCDQKTEVEKVEKVKVPGGEETKTTKVEDKKSGEMKDPAPSPAEPPK